jgi:hypothetical protein
VLCLPSESKTPTQDPFTSTAALKMSYPPPGSGQPQGGYYPRTESLCNIWHELQLTLVTSASGKRPAYEMLPLAQRSVLRLTDPDSILSPSTGANLSAASILPSSPSWSLPSASECTLPTTSAVIAHRTDSLSTTHPTAHRPQTLQLQHRPRFCPRAQDDVRPLCHPSTQPATILRWARSSDNPRGR